MYDWANSVYNLVITSTIFPAFFESITGDGNDATPNDKVAFLGRTFVNTSLYNYVIAFALLIVAISLPLLSSIADNRGTKKIFLSIFSAMGSIGCMCLYFFTDVSSLWVGILGMIIACICYWASLVFYNSYLPEIAAVEDRDSVSAKGFSYGYIGSVLLQLICFVLVFFPGIVGGSAEKGNTTTIQFQVSFLMVGLWWFIFSRISLRGLPKGTPTNEGEVHNVFTDGYRELRKVWSQLKKHRVLRQYLFAFLFISMGVQTVMLAATLYGKGELKIPVTNLIGAILVIQLVAIGGAMLISKLSGRYGNINVLIGCTSIWILICIIGYTIPAGNITLFYMLAVLVGMVMGGIQALARSTYAKLMPATNDTASYFSFYEVTEKIGIVIGMFSFGFISELTGSQRNSVLGVGIFFITAILFLLITKNKTKN
jgi:UMF1 family MFS transporter